MSVGRSAEVAQRFIQKLFSKNPGGVEKHLSRADIEAIVVAAYEVGYEDGAKIATKETK